ncbi:MAG: TetR/AcrR family transcriptional regulator [Sedimentisphaeraceae bacterium JB056]
MGKIDTKTALLNCAQDLVQKVGVNAMSYNDLSEAVGIRKASIHYHFPKKDDLIEALQQKCMVEYCERYMIVVDSDLSAPDKLRKLTDIYINTLNGRKLCLVAMLSAEYETLSDRLRELMEQSVITTTRIYEKIFIKGIADGELLSCDDTFDAAYAFFSFLMGGHIIARCSGGEKALRRASEIYINKLTA